MSNITYLGELIRSYRKKMGLTPAQLADLAGVSKRYIEQLESGGKINPTLNTFLRIVLVLSSPHPKKLPKHIEWDNSINLLTETLFKLALFDEQSIHLFNKTFPQYISLMKTASDYKYPLSPRE